MIMMDIMMPAMSGIEVLKKICADEVLANVQIVILTSLTDNETVIEAIQSVSTSWCQKIKRSRDAVGRSKPNRM